MLEIEKESLQAVPTNAAVGAYLEVPDGHRSIDARGAELPTVPFVHLINGHLAASREREP